MSKISKIIAKRKKKSLKWKLRKNSLANPIINYKKTIFGKKKQFKVKKGAKIIIKKPLMANGKKKIFEPKENFGDNLIEQEKRQKEAQDILRKYMLPGMNLIEDDKIQLQPITSKQEKWNKNSLNNSKYSKFHIIKNKV